MKLKRTYIIIFSLIIGLFGIGLMFKYKNLIISNTSNKQYKAASIHFKENIEEECDRYYSEYKSLTNDDTIINIKTFSDNYFQVVKASNTNIDGDSYMYNGCAYKINDFIQKYIEDEGSYTGICDAVKSKAQNDFTVANVFNASSCVTKYNYTQQYASYGNSTGTLENRAPTCDAHYDNYWKDTANMYFSEQHNGIWFQILKRENYTNNTGETYDDVFLYNGCAWSFNDFVKKYKEQTNNYNVCSSLSNLVDERNTSYLIGTFNESLCVTQGGYSKKSLRNTCTIEWDDESDGKFEGAFFKVNGNKQPLDYYIDQCGCNENLKYFIATKQKDIYEDKCHDTIPITNKCEEIETIDSTGTSKKHYYFNGIVQGGSCATWGTGNKTCGIYWDTNYSDGFSGANFMMDGYGISLEEYIKECKYDCNTLKNFISEGQRADYEKVCGTLPENGCEKIGTYDTDGNYFEHYYNDGIVVGPDSSYCPASSTCEYKFITANSNAPGLQLNGWVGYGSNGKQEYEWTEEWLTSCVDSGKITNTSNLKYFVKTSEAKQVLANNGIPVLNETGYHTHDNIVDSSGNTHTVCFKNGVFNNYGSCVLECNNTTRNNIIASNDAIEAKNFNNSCPYLTPIDISTVTLEWLGGSGPGDLGVDWEGGYGTYKITGIVGKQLQINFDNVLQYPAPGGLDLIGWSTDSNCNTITKPSTGLNHTFTVESSAVTYYACYEEDIYSTSLFKANGDKKTDPDDPSNTYVSETNQCDNTPENKAGLNRVPMESSSLYRKSSYNTMKVSNPYCNILCTDTVEVTYPNIFETVPAGQYFELLYEPQIEATRVCQSEFNYSKWERDYQNAINQELSALSELERAEAYLEAVEALQPSGNVYNCGSTYICGGTAENPIECYTGQTKSDTKTKYYYDANGNSLSQTATFSACDSTDTSSLKQSAENSLKTARNAYASAVNSRLKFEQYNLQCYTVLDSNVDNTTNLNYSDIFSNNYETITHLSPTYNVDTQKVNVATDSYGTKGNYLNYIINNTSSSNTPVTDSNLKNLNINTGINTKSFYSSYPQLTFTYDTGSSGSPQNNNKSNITDTLLRESQVKLDTGSFTSDTSGYLKDATTQTYTRNFSLEGVNGNYINFNAYTARETFRRVKYLFIFHEGTEFFSNLQSGAYSKVSSSNNVSLSKQTKYSVGDTTTPTITISNHVYPVSLKAVTDSYQVSFNLSDGQENYLKNTFNIDATTDNFTCSYKITNDTLVLGGKKQTYKDLKSNTIFRSVATYNLDPNDRSSTGKLGENWLNAKGQAVMTKIQSTEGTSGERNTYKPDNLEYSFTLTPSIINAIKDYNATTNYDDFNLQCATKDGRECVSSFLTELAQGKVDRITVQPNYSSINSWGTAELKSTREKWKYYDGNGNIIEKTATYNNSLNKITTPAMNLDEYLDKYEKWGVLP